MLESRLLAQERAYRSASQALDCCVIGVSSVLLAGSMFLIEPTRPCAASNVVALAAALLFAVSLIAGLKKLEYYVVILGTNYSISQAESDRGSQTIGSSSTVVAQLHETVQEMSHRASLAHRLRNWCLLLGILFFTISRLIAGLFAM